MKDIKNKKEEELSKLLVEKREALRSFRFSMGAGKQKNVKEGRNVRKEIAQILTELHARA